MHRIHGMKKHGGGKGRHQQGGPRRGRPQGHAGGAPKGHGRRTDGGPSYARQRPQFRNRQPAGPKTCPMCGAVVGDLARHIRERHDDPVSHPRE